jgi:ketosteroid isomerase-like protein
VGEGTGSTEALVSTEAHKDVVRRFLDALVNDETATIRPLVTDGVLWWVPPSAGASFGLARPLVGWDGIPWFGGDGWKGFRPGTSAVILHHLVAEGDLVSAHYNRTAIRTNGNPYDNEYNILFRFEGGRIAEVWEVVDTA